MLPKILASRLIAESSWTLNSPTRSMFVLWLPSKKDIFCHWKEKQMTGIIVQLTTKLNQSGIPCQFWTSNFMPLDFLEFLAPWTRNLTTTNSHYLPNLTNCIWARFHWVWEQLPFKLLNMIGSMLLIMLKTTTLWRPSIHPTWDKMWRQCGLLPTFGHIFIVSALIW